MLSLDLRKHPLADVCQQKGHAEYDQQTDKITAAHSKYFHFASGLLPEEKRSAVVSYTPFAGLWTILWLKIKSL